MTQYDFGTIDTSTTDGVDLAGMLEDHRDAVHSDHKGSTAPPYAQDGMRWIDDSGSPWVWKKYDGADWITIGHIDPATNAFSLAAQADGDAAGDVPTIRQIQKSGVSYAASGGSGGAYTVTLSPPPEAYTAGLRVQMKANHTSPGASTVNVNGLGNKTIQKVGQGLASGDITSADMVDMIYDGAAFQLLSPHRTPVLANNAIAYGKIQKMSANLRVLGNVSGAAGDVAEIEIKDEDDMASDSAIAVSTQKSSKAYVDAKVRLPRGFISGFVIKNNSGDSAHDLDISAGECRAESNAADIVLSAMTKRFDATWSAGTGNGGLSSSLTVLAADTWYHVFAVLISGSADVIADTSVSCANGVADHSVTAYRRIGSFKTNGSATIIAFKANEISGGGIKFEWVDPPLDFNTSVNTSTSTITLDYVPTGMVSETILNVYQTGTGTTGYIFPTDITEETPSSTGAPLGSIGGVMPAQIFVRSDVSAQIKARTSNGSGETVRITVIGWADYRL